MLVRLFVYFAYTIVLGIYKMNVKLGSSCVRLCYSFLYNIIIYILFPNEFRRLRILSYSIEFILEILLAT
jgi:hypothetical protein